VTGEPGGELDEREHAELRELLPETPGLTDRDLGERIRRQFEDRERAT
jgi:hypothetical protein